MGVKLAFGIHDGRVIHISEIEPNNRGEKCNCKCPTCHSPLVAKLGHGERMPHFAHTNNCECDVIFAQQTGLHLLAKEIIFKSHRITLPGWSISRSEITPANHNSEISRGVRIELPTFSAKEFTYDSAELEKSFGSIIADAVISIRGKPCIVEIAVTHFVDEIKKEKTVEINCPMIEIDLSDLVDNTTSREEITKAVLSSCNNRKWIYNQKRDDCLANKKSEFKQKYAELLIAKEKEQRRKDEYKARSITAFRELFTPEKYAKEIQKLCNERRALFWLKRFDFSGGLEEYPFYMNIPITGEFVISSDRRIWQGKLFEDYIFRGFGEELCFFSISQIRKRISKGSMIIQFDKQKTYRTEVLIGEEEHEISLSYDVIKQYFYYLELLGFAYHLGYEWFSKRPQSLNPPEQSTAIIVEEVIKSVDAYSPNVDQIIKNELLLRLPDCKRSIIDTWNEE